MKVGLVTRTSTRCRAASTTKSGLVDMGRVLRHLSATVCLLAVLAGAAPVRADEPVVRAVVFYHPGCAHCQQVMSVDLPPLVAWVIGTRAAPGVARAARAALVAMTFAGSAFSIYLTFLEPFVIGATCAWCLTSAVLMTVLLVAAVPSMPGPRTPVPSATAR